MSDAGVAIAGSPTRMGTPFLIEHLRRAIAGEVRFDAGSRALYSADASNYRQLPIGIVIPRTIEDIVETVRICREFDAPILPRGGGTSMCGQAVNVAVVIDTSKYLNCVLEVDASGRSALVEPGVICDALRDAAEMHALTFAPDPSTHSRCTLGGMIGNNSCGPHSVMSGKTEENIEALEILTYDGARFWVGPTNEGELEEAIRQGGRRGEIYAKLKSLRDRYADEIRARFPHIRRRVSGYNLNQLLPEHGFNVARALVGSEGTCAITLQARTALVPSPRARAILVLGYSDVFQAGDAVPRILPHRPMAMEGLESGMIEGIRRKGLKLDDLTLLPPGNAWLVVEFGADEPAEAAGRARALMSEIGRQNNPPNAVIYETAKDQSRVWSIRELGASASSLSDTPDQLDPKVGWEDAAVDPARLGNYLREFYALIDRYGYRTSLYGHFGDGCIHAWITFDLRTSAGLRTWRQFLVQAAELVVKYGGSLNGEHGDGRAKSEFLPIMFGEKLMQAFREFKAIWDPRGRMNPGIIVNPQRIEDNLRKGPDYRPAAVNTHFSFVGQGASYARALEHCIGLGKCRAKKGGTMCPSYRATGEERHCTRGRSRLLFEMLRGEWIRDGWKSDEVREVLDLCLSCKGCRSDCPTHVDMATYKAEFLSHYYSGRLRPRAAYVMGMIGEWAPLAGAAPRLANFPFRIGWLGRALKSLAGIAPERDIPAFARRNFRAQFSKRNSSSRRATRVLLWPDTFTNYFEPEIALAAIEVLEHAGCDVHIPQHRLCCGRPLYDFGMVRLAKRRLMQIMDALAADIEAGLPVVGLEPACVAVFRDELVNLFPRDRRARKLARQVFMLSEFLVQHAQYRPPALRARALVHEHCHHKAVLGTADEATLLHQMGLDFHVLDSGCCGMAGSFGFERDKYPVSMRIGESILLPQVRKAGADTFIVADGYSCREQIRQGANREALHLAQVIQLAIRQAQGVGAAEEMERKTDSRPVIASM
jgi:FAD/FMN-containing dehydrogenase/Fe-S oxidoreductase